jgi:ABC-type antimicrobial peptide transport system permease subunit
MGDSMIGKISAALIAGAVCVAGAPALAADFEMADATVVATEAVPPGGWEVKVTPYGWMSGMNGTVTARGRSVSTAMSFIDIVKDSDELIPFMGAWSVGKDRFSIFGDFFYSQIGFSAQKSVQVNPVAGLVLSAKGKAGLTTTMTIAQVALAYDVIKQGGTSVGFYAGARYWYVDADLTLKITGEVDLSNLGLKRKGKYALAQSGGFDWIDPLVGIKVKQELTPADELTLVADIGGFGVGSEFSWQVFGGYSHNWQITRSTQMALALGYRILSVDYTEGKGIDAKGLDLTLHGPLAGLTFTW